ncbi:MAG TPA: carbonate dehydratase, partial [Flavobacteriales bacterium]|nr:carbonate dehydratase [Flavobacteriales bacterium]HRE95993.1 carbonate dehydratase [Flavobacteriales bacterium]HRJ34825.1 carbonate dehydratase [Flavobacteriales bacterium]HRJ38139.1 carbonate dehydratase [Flavobacteriales bacterium]
MKSYEKLLLENKAWAGIKTASDPSYFPRMARDQKPEFLWIGCSDSRVPANEITNTEPGEMFVHRNIANLVVHTDLNLLSVLQYAVEVLEVKHIIVCGHYGCGGVRAAMTQNHLGLINKWLRNIKDVYRANRSEMEAIKDENKKVDRLCELNVIEQVNHLAETSIIQRAWKNHKRPMLHGWIYGLNDGIIKEITVVEPNAPIDPLYTFKFDNE